MMAMVTQDTGTEVGGNKNTTGRAKVYNLHSMPAHDIYTHWSNSGETRYIPLSSETYLTVSPLLPS